MSIDLDAIKARCEQFVKVLAEVERLASALAVTDGSAAIGAASGAADAPSVKQNRPGTMNPGPAERATAIARKQVTS